MNTVLGTRLRALREEHKLSQDDLARVFGFKDRQTVSAIETGERRLSVDELMTVVEKLGTSFDYFTDPFRLVGEGTFSWRRLGRGSLRLDVLEESVGHWIAAYRVLAPQIGQPIPMLRRTLRLTRRESFDSAVAAGERLAAEFDLGPVPALRLADAMERELGVLVLMIDAVDSISAGACRLPEFDTVLINRRRSTGRRHFDLAYELFHILTWDTIPPEHIEAASEQSRNRVEQLANNFASALLMPASVLDRFGSWNGDLINQLNSVASTLAVPAIALKWRLVALGRLERAMASVVPDEALLNNGRSIRSGAPRLTRRFPVVSRHAPDALEAPPPLLLSKSFVKVMALAVLQGRISARRTANLLDMTLEEFVHLCGAYGIEPAPFDL